MVDFSAAYPDSYVSFNEHKIYDDLFKKFVDKNHENNSRDSVRLWSLILNCKQIFKEGIQGDLAEVGVFRGNSAAVLAEFAKLFDRKVYLFDTFEGFVLDDLEGVDREESASYKNVTAYSNTSIDMVKEVIGDSVDVCSFVEGYFPDSMKEEHKQNNYSIISVDCDLYKPVKAVLDKFYPLLNAGGIFFVHDYSSGWWDGVTQAVDEFCTETGERLICVADKSGSAFIRKTR